MKIRVQVQQEDLSTCRDGAGGDPKKPACGIVASGVVDDRVAYGSSCGGSGFAWCDGAGTV